MIINKDGSIYHLQLHPEQVADTILTVGDPARVAAVSKYFDRIESKTAHREFVTHTGWLGNKRLTVLATGIGTDNIDIVLNELDALVNIDFQTRTPNPKTKQLNIIRIGTSGALWAGAGVDSFVISAAGIGLDNLLHFYHYNSEIAENELLEQFQAFFPTTPLPAYAFAAHQDLVNSLNIGIQGITITSPGFYAPQGRHLRTTGKLNIELLNRLNDFQYKNWRIANFEMETAAIYGLSALLGHRALSCNVILANRILGQFSPDPAAAVDRLIQIVLEKISKSLLF